MFIPETIKTDLCFVRFFMNKSGIGFKQFYLSISIQLNCFWSSNLSSLDKLRTRLNAAKQAQSGPISLIRHSYSSSYGNVMIKLLGSFFRVFIITCLFSQESSGIGFEKPTEVKRIMSLNWYLKTCLDIFKFKYSTFKNKFWCQGSDLK